ncbi:hypothetical protein LTR66_012502 [Elasticomyces elasticus]|nr:hypothetical protein LTR66_012502 [Elasticomyces elasticus]
MVTGHNFTRRLLNKTKLRPHETPATDTMETESIQTSDDDPLPPLLGPTADNLPHQSAQTTLRFRPVPSPTPSYIGPPPTLRHTTPGAPTMTQTVRITYSHPGTRPPVYIVTSLSKPQWDVLEMSSRSKGEEYEFYYDFEGVEEGEYQYKFRLGPGDWWVLDQKQTMAVDCSGNLNNVIDVAPAHDKLAEKRRPVPETAAAAVPVQELEKTTRADSELTKREEEAPLMRHETILQPTQQAAGAQHGSEVEDREDYEAEDEEPVPLFRHETTMDRPADLTQEAAETDDAAPLFRHETMPLQADEGQPPLLHHETLAAGQNFPDSESAQRGTRDGQSSSYYDYATVDDYNNRPSIERFPTDPQAILEQIQRTSSRLPEDRTVSTGTSPSPVAGRLTPDVDVRPITLSRPASEVSLVSSTPLVTISESDDEDEEPPAPATEFGDPSEQDTTTTIPSALEAARAEAPPTPPMTPKDTQHDGTSDASALFASQKDGEEGAAQLNSLAASPSALVKDAKTQNAGFFAGVWNVLFGGWMAPVGRWLLGLCGGVGRATGAIVVVLGAAVAAAAALAYRDRIA